jgi:hypothetical protein
MSRNYSSTAVDTTLSSGVSPANTTITVASTTGFPAAPFTLALDAGTASQELVLVTAVGGTTLTVTRGYDSTVAATHEAGAAVSHSHAAIDFREAGTTKDNYDAHAAATVAHGATGAVVGTTNTQTLTNKTLTAPALTAPTATGSLAGFGAGWTPYTPTWTGTGSNPSLGNGTISGRYFQIGKTVHFQIHLVIGSTTTFGTGRWDFTLPVASTGYSVFYPFGVAVAYDTGTRPYGGQTVYVGSTKVCAWRDSGAAEAVVTPTTPHTWAAGDVLELQGTYEAS